MSVTTLRAKVSLGVRMKRAETITVSPENRKADMGAESLLVYIDQKQEKQ